jgi:hypothetical protein
MGSGWLVVFSDSPIFKLVSIVEPLAEALRGALALNDTVTKQPTMKAVRQKPIFIFTPLEC